MDLNPTLADRVGFQVNHEAWRVDSNAPDIFLRDRGYTAERQILQSSTFSGVPSDHCGIL